MTRNLTALRVSPEYDTGIRLRAAFTPMYDKVIRCALCCTIPEEFREKKIVMNSMKVLIISDTHGSDSTGFCVVRKEKPFDMLIHAGDVCHSEQLYEALAGVESHIVAGNCDHTSDYPDEDIFQIGPYRTLLTHGHRFYVSSGEDLLVSTALKEKARIVIYGHTHIPAAHFVNGVLVLNPGSLAFPRQKNRKPSYIIMTIREDETLHCEIRYQDKKPAGKC